ncbi:MAG: site-specific DNA-methyltransferase [Nocardioidaceae bacterium]|nr:MAG: site-specific DNA-methyltransferase [Nocardioidaceae bacterium]
MLVEGDNLEVLKLLQPAYADRVGLIYIDPPYNTGNDFVYDDDLTDPLGAYLQRTGQLDDSGRRTSSSVETSGRGHSRWLSMIYPRLLLGRALLTQQGAIFVSIDEHEVAHLRLVLDEVFGQENFIAQLAVSLNPKGRQLGRFFATSHEYLLVYARDIELCALQPASADDVDAGDFPLYDEARGLHHRLLPLRNTNKKFNPSTAPTMAFAVYGDPESGRVAVEPFPGAVEIWPVFGDASAAVWRWSATKIADQAEDLVCRLVRGRAGQRVDVFQKDWLAPGRTKKLKTIWTAEEAGTTDQAVAEVKERIGPIFETPKPLKLMRRILATMPEDIMVVDFFAGSGTMAEAVLGANADDGGTRRFVCVNLPEPTLSGSAARAAGFTEVSQIMLTRLSRRTAHQPEDPVRHFRLAASAFNHSDDQERTLVRDPDDGVVAELLAAEGVGLHEPWQRIRLGDVEVVLAAGVAVVLSLELDAGSVASAIALAPRTLVFLEDAFAGADALKLNAIEQGRYAGVLVRTR